MTSGGPNDAHQTGSNDEAGEPVEHPGFGEPTALTDDGAVRPPEPRATGTITVATDRHLGWAEFGHPDGDPVLWFHGTPGARTQIPPAVDEVALANGFRIITVERPGTGRSTDHHYHRVLDFAADVEVVADELGLDRFAVVGLSGGGPYALGVAHALPERVVCVTLLGGLGPVRGPDAVLSYTRVLRLMAPPLEVLRSPLGSLVNGILKVATPFADLAYGTYATVLGLADRDTLRLPAFRAMFIRDLVEAGELRAAAHDLALFSRHWGFNLDEVTVPVICWQGLADHIVPPSHGHHQAARLPLGELRVRQGAGHFAGFNEVADVLGRLRQVWALRTEAPTTSSTD